jgi:allantoate deiminase
MVSGSTRLEFCITGQAQHTGGTPMSLRKDALVAAAAVVTSAERLANDPRYRGTRATVGRLAVFPNSITTIPGRVTFTVDIRDVDSDRQRQAAREITRRAREVCEVRDLSCTVRVIADASPTVLPVWLREVTMEACSDLGIEYRVMSSGASHDAQVVNDVVPAGMVFVPSRAGLSHVPEEWSSSTDIARGARVLVAAIERLDPFLAGIDEPAVLSGS